MKINKKVNSESRTPGFYVTENGVMDHQFKMVTRTSTKCIFEGPYMIISPHIALGRCYDRNMFPPNFMGIILQSGSQYNGTTCVDRRYIISSANNAKNVCKKFMFVNSSKTLGWFVKVPKNIHIMLTDTDLVKKLPLESHSHFKNIVPVEISDYIHVMMLELICHDIKCYPEVPADNEYQPLLDMDDFIIPEGDGNVEYILAGDD